MSQLYDHGNDGQVVMDALGSQSLRVIEWTISWEDIQVAVGGFSAQRIGDFEQGNQKIAGTIRVARYRADAPVVISSEGLITLRTASTAPFRQYLGSARITKIDEGRRKGDSTEADTVAYAFIGFKTTWPEPTLTAA